VRRWTSLLAVCLVLVIAPRSAGGICIGDCNSSSDVTVDELITGVNIALGALALDQCEAFESNTDGVVTVDELITAVNNALVGCTPEPTKTPTPPLVTVPPSTATPTVTLIAPATLTSTMMRPSVTPTEIPTPPTPSETNPPSPNDETAVSTVFDSTRFLYEGGNPPQKGVAPGTIEPVHAAVVRGRVLDRTGTGLAGVRVTVADHPELGEVLSDSEGAYALAINGGGRVVIGFEKAGTLGAERSVETAPQGWTVVDDVVLMPFDTAATTIDLSGTSTSWQTHQGTMQADADGMRCGTLLFPPGITATLVPTVGSPSPFTGGTVRVTEFTVGPRGEQAMPAELPPTSNYTYAAGFDFDEAVAANALYVEFSDLVPLYVENFLDFPVGIEVPFGFYDKVKHAWVREPNGVIARIVGTTGGMVDLDLDGEAGGDPGADPELYAAFGISDGEREALAGLTFASPELWRVQLTHFSRGDLNWSAILPSNARRATRKGADALRRLTNKGPKRNNYGSIEPEEQVFHEDVGLVGLPFGLHYTSKRQAGRAAEYEVTVPITDASPPASLESVVTELRVAGRVIRNEWSNAPNQVVTLSWDGTDGFGREVVGRQRAEVRIGYVYVPQFVRGAGFAVPRSEVLRAGRAGQRLTLWSSQSVALGEVSTGAAGLGGWTPEIFHTYDPVGRVLHQGDGTVRSVEGSVLAAETIVSGGDLTRVAHTVVDADGTIVYLDTNGPPRIRRLDPESGTFTTLAGGSTDQDTDDGGVAANLAGLVDVDDIAIGADGTIYWAEGSVHRVRRVRDGFVSTVAGRYGEPCAEPPTGVCGNGGPVAEALLKRPEDIAVMPDGSLLIAEFTERRLRRIDPAGIIDGFLGTGASCAQGFGTDPACLTTTPVFARTQRISQPYDVEAAADGTVYVRVDSTFAYILEVSPQGLVRRIAGKAASGGLSGEGVDALEMVLSVDSSETDLGVAPDGTLYVGARTAAGQPPRIREIGSDGLVRSIALAGPAGSAGGDGGPALLAQLGENLFSGSFGVAPDGSLVVEDQGNQRFLQMLPALPGFTNEGILIPSEDASEVYIFDASGRHLSTRDALTGATLWSFSYDAEGLLISIADREGDLTTITRNASGTATAITSPDGDMTRLEIDADGDLVAVTNPADETTRFEYTDGRLLTAVTGPRGNRFSFTYDALGRLTRAEDPPGTGGSLTLERETIPGGFRITETTALARTTVHDLETLSNGDAVRQLTTPDGLVTTTRARADGSTHVTLPDGTTLDTEIEGDPRFGIMAPVLARSVIDTPGLAPRTTTRTRTATFANPDDPLSLQTLTETETTNGKTATLAYDASSRVSTLTSPAGRVTTNGLDAKGRVAQTQAPGEAPVAYSYDARGRLTRVEQGTGPDARVATATYRANGTPETLTDPAGNSSTVTFDLARRLTASTLPAGGSVQMAYDQNGNLTGLTPPERPAHAFAYTPVELASTYTPPAIPGGAAENDPATTAFDADRQPVTTTLPGAVAIGFGYDAAGRVEAVTIPSGTFGVSYHPTTGYVQTLTAPAGGGTITYATDGILPASQTWSVAVAGSISRSYDADYRLATRSVNGGNTVAFSYDADSLLTGVSGALTAALTREPATGRASQLDQADVRETLAYAPIFGELAGQTVNLISAPATVLYDADYTRDKLGRLATRAETVGGATTTTTYTYDGNGRLVSAVESGASANSYAYTYDRNGNRLSGPGGVTYAYDAQDRLVSSSAAGGTTYAYTPHGKLAEKTAGGQTTAYTYDALGNLRQVALPGGPTVSYRVDGEGNRIERTDGTTTRRWLYDGAGRIVAELDGNDALVSLFVYAATAFTPDLMLQGGTAYRIISDQVGSVRLVVEAATGAIAQQIDYDPFGRVLADTNPGFQPFGFAGGHYDPATGLLRFGARDYDPEIGRWTAKDPIGFAGGDANLYGYVGSDPANDNDPTGLGPRGRRPPHRRYTHKVTLYYYKPHLPGPSHLAIGIDNERPRGFYPGDGAILPTSIGQVKPDNPRADETFSFPVTTKEAEDIREFVDNAERSPGIYDFVSKDLPVKADNCATFCRSALEEAGIIPPYALQTGITPGGVLENVRIYIQDNR
jgi:RHS repeat-associated protein